MNQPHDGQEASGRTHDPGRDSVPYAIRLLGLLLIVLGLALAAGGAWLIVLHGSPEPLVLGLGLLCAGVLVFAGDARGAFVYVAVVLAAGAWAVHQVGRDGWALLPRTGLLLLLLLLLATAWRRTWAPAGRVIALVAGLGGLATLTWLVFQVPAAPPPATDTHRAARDAPQHDDDWLSYGRTLAATRYAPAAQITPANVATLRQVWVHRSGETATDEVVHNVETTPIKAGRTLYICTPHNVIVAVDAATGQERWRHDPHVNPADTMYGFCRGVSYFKSPGPAQGEQPATCAERIIEGTLDFRLIAVDAGSGQPCPGFGKDGEVNLREGFGPVPPNFVKVTSPPTIADGVIIVGHMVMDNQRVNSPSGVIRGYDATTGTLRWAWDPAKPDTASPLKAGELYMPGTPNAWAVFAADESRGLVYVPFGGASPDYFGGHRTPTDERFGSAIVALDINTGQLRWSFQTVHHDLWDYDLGAQPSLVDFPTAGGPVPALIQGTKTGELYVLDRRTGRPLTAVAEKPAPAGAVAGDFTAPTQPSSVGMPDVRGRDLTEKDVWGLTPIDRLMCQIEFRKSNYRGRYTPPSTRPYINYPGFAGGIDWGGVAVDQQRDILIVNASRFANRNILIPRKTLDAQGVTKALGDPGIEYPVLYPSPMAGTPYGTIDGVWLSPLKLPCQRPPWGTITGIDLKTRKVIWERPLGTTYDRGLFGIPSRIAAPAGVPNQGGAVVTATGLTFIAATLDNFLRAFDTRTGAELWRARLPAGSQANPISYMLDGRQYVVVAAGGHSVLGSTPGDYLVAFALPKAE
jgi:membrane-bound PQQ-dependent dehydrogenase (glucose/quinate/shikimate family)